MCKSSRQLFITVHTSLTSELNSWYIKDMTGTLMWKFIYHYRDSNMKQAEWNMTFAAKEYTLLGSTDSAVMWLVAIMHTIVP